jgi:hypothetical protein
MHLFHFVPCMRGQIFIHVYCMWVIVFLSDGQKIMYVDPTVEEMSDENNRIGRPIGSRLRCLLLRPN